MKQSANRYVQGEPKAQLRYALRVMISAIIYKYYDSHIVSLLLINCLCSCIFLLLVDPA
jgi:hypothetical protein